VKDLHQSHCVHTLLNTKMANRQSRTTSVSVCGLGVVGEERNIVNSVKMLRTHEKVTSVSLIADTF